MKRIHSLSQGFLVTLLLSLASGCGPEFQSAAYEGGEAGAGEAAAGTRSTIEPQAGASSAATGGSAGSGGGEPRGGATGKSGGKAGSGSGGTGMTGESGAAGEGTGGSVAPRGGAAGSGGAGSAESGAGGDSEPQAGAPSAGTAGSDGEGGAPSGPTCSPSEGTVELNAMTFSLGEYNWTDGENCMLCPEGGCGTCTVETAYLERLADANDPGMNLRVTAHCDGGVLAGTCGAETYCDEQVLYSADAVAHFIARVDFVPSADGYEMVVRRHSEIEYGMTTHGLFSCAPQSMQSDFLGLFYDTMDHSPLRCD